MIARIVSIAALGLAAAGLVMYLNLPNSVEAANEGKALADVIVPELSTVEKAGEVAFNKNCSSCHGVNGAGKDGFAPPLIHKIYEPSHHGDMSFVRAAKQGVRQHHWRFGNMLPVEGITDEEISKVITYVRAVQRANGID